MALSPPSVAELESHAHWDAGYVNATWGADVLQIATDLFQIATDIDDTPDDPLQLRMYTLGVLAMAHALYVRFGDRDAIYSPFSSERLGSYSYSIREARSQGNPITTGVGFFDFVVNWFLGLDEENAKRKIWSDSTKVFTDPNPDDYKRFDWYNPYFNDSTVPGWPIGVIPPD